MQGHDAQEILISGTRHTVHQVHPIKFERGVLSGKKCPEKARAVAEIGKRMRRNTAKPRPGEPRRAEDDVILAFKPDHHEFAGGPGPITVPASRVVALGDEQGVLKAVLAPRHWKLILLRKIRDGAESEDDKRMQRDLAAHVQNSVASD